MDLNWIKDRIVNLLIYGTIIIFVCFVLYSAFLKPTTNNRTTQDATTINNSLAGGTVKIGFGGCAMFVPYTKEKK